MSVSRPIVGTRQAVSARLDDFCDFITLPIKPTDVKLHKNLCVYLLDKTYTFGYVFVIIIVNIYGKECFEMKTFRKVVSLAIAATMMTSSLGLTVSAVQKSDAAVSASTTLKDSVQDGVILHAFNWSYNSIKDNLPAIAAAGYTTVQTSPVQQPKDYGTSNDVAGQWWKLYQPVSMAVAQKSWLGTKTELKALCTEAEKYGIKIICDIVSNHMGNQVEEDPNSLSEQVQTYQPDFYENKDTYFRNNKITAGDGSVQAVVQGHLSACPDLNTGNQKVQDAVVTLLKECIDCGVDGFRFDAAKHIETPSDGATYGSDYWAEISGKAGDYYKQKTGDELYIYGEILNSCGAGRKYSAYTEYINVTDNRTGDAVLSNVVKGNASTAASAGYKSGVAASDAVLWAESHDTFEGTSGSAGIANTADVSDENIIKAWAIVAARKDATALYFARPGAALMGEAGTNTAYKSTAVTEINKFHNLFTGQAEKLGSADGVAYVARGTSGIVLSNCTGTTKNVSIADTGLANGTYTDTITGNKFTVANGVLTGSIGSTGVAVVYDGTTTPKNTCNTESTEFKGETITVTLGLENATSGTYCIDNSEPVAYTGTTTIRMGSDYEYGETINLTLTATDGKKTTTATYKYKKEQSASSGVYVFFNSARKSTWTAPFNIYVYDEDTSDAETYANSSWPGQPMQLDEATGYYYYEVPATGCLATDADSNVTSSTFDLAHSVNANVIISDASGKQYPGSNARTKLNLAGSSKMYALTASNSWADTDLVPTKTEIEATEVTQGNAKPTAPVGSLVYGNADLDERVSIMDATAIMKHAVELSLLSGVALELADVNEDGIVNVMDATAIQKYLNELDGCGRTGKPYTTEPQPTTVAPNPTTQPTTAPQPTTQPTTAPVADTYTFYFKTTLGWMTSDGVSVFAYDKATGESYYLEKLEDAYPNVYTAEVPASMTDCIVYRYIEETTEYPVGGDTGTVYNAWEAGRLSKTSNCVTLSNDEVVTVGPYVEEETPEFSLSTVYFDNSKAKWSEVYIYGWAESMLGNTAYKMTKIDGTDIWYFDLDTELMPGAKCFLFKDTKSTWVNQTKDIVVEDGKNCYRANAGSKSGGTWYLYEG